MNTRIHDLKSHWDTVHATKPETAVSWYQAEPRLSLELIVAAARAIGPRCRIIDVGGGASVLVDRLLDLPFERIAVLDISAAAVGRTKSRLGARATRVEWLVADITVTDDLGSFEIWHDRALFHFLIDESDRRRYAELARKTVVEGGRVIIAAFAECGPKQCSNLDVRRYNVQSLGAELGAGFTLEREVVEEHVTPWGASQTFVYGLFVRC